MPSIASAVASIKQTDSLIPADEILLAAARVGHRFRDRVFEPVLTVGTQGNSRGQEFKGTQGAGTQGARTQGARTQGELKGPGPLTP